MTRHDLAALGSFPGRMILGFTFARPVTEGVARAAVWSVTGQTSPSSYDAGWDSLQFMRVQ